MVEELDDFIETHCKALGVEVTGKALFPRCGEFSQKLVKKLLAGEEEKSLSWRRRSPSGPRSCAPAVPTAACSTP